MNEPQAAPAGVTLEMRRTINATPERLFAAWTDPEQIVAWWGPKDVDCIGAEIDLRVGGRYRIGNQLADGTTIWIVGTFETIEPPRALTYSWLVEGIQSTPERVHVRFEARGGGTTELIINHQRIPGPALRDQHADGWRGCLDGLAAYVAAAWE